uniref:Uncharacterized protein n=1 Tax=Cyanothece sp. (strain PCC 7425 / ATCC 29141) TaxID=395961 RepID=B8HYK7_CYAP4
MLISISDRRVGQVQTAIETALASYDHHPYRHSFTAPRLRQQLVKYVLQHLPLNLAEEDMASSMIQHLITEGIHHLMIENSPWTCQPMPHPYPDSEMPAHWFG